MNQNSPFRTWLILATILLLLLAGCTYIVYSYWQVNYSETREEISRDIKLLGSLTQNDLRTGQYQHIKELLQQWGKNDPEVCLLRLQSHNGFVISEYQSDLPVTHTLSREIIINYSYSGNARLILRKTIDDIIANTRNLAVQIGGAYIVIVIMLITLVRLLLLHRQETLLLRKNTAELDASYNDLKNEIVQRRMAETERDQLVSMMEATTDMIGMADINGQAIYLNTAMRKLYGYGDTSVPDMRIPDFHPQWATELIMKEGLPAAEKNGVWAGETAILTPDGREIPVSQVLLSHRDEDGKVDYYSTIMRDISDRKASEKMLLRHNRLLSTLTSVTESLMLETDSEKLMQGICQLLVNESQFRMAWIGLVEPDGVHVKPVAKAGFEEGYLEKTTIRCDASDQGKGPTGTSIRMDTTMILGDAETDEYYAPWREIARQQGYRSSLATPVHMHGKVIGAINVYSAEPHAFGKDEAVLLEKLASDLGRIMERNTAEAALRESEAQFRLLLDSAAEGIYGVNIAGRCIFINRAALRMLGYSNEKDFIGQNVHNMIHYAHADGSHYPIEECQVRHSIIDGKSAHADDEVHWRADGSSFPVEYWSHPMLREGNLVGAVVTFVDITERKQSQEALQQLNNELEDRVKQRTSQLLIAKEEAERASLAKSDFLSRMSHELRTPLNAILGFGQLLECDPRYPLSDNQRDHIKEILHAGSHLLELINEVLDLARVEAGKLTVSHESVNVPSVLQECITLIQPLAETRHISIKNIECNCEFTVQADRTRLKQVLINLLTNAVKYNRENGSVTIKCFTKGSHTEIHITDTGAGLTASQQKKLFVAFNRINEDSSIEGTGIGLALSKRLMELMHGSIGMDSIPGVGSTFWIRLPATVTSEKQSRQNIPQASIEPASIEEPTNHTLEVLCIEDNPANMRLIENIFNLRKDIHLLTATTPDVGLELAESHQPALILLDINLPVMDGYAVMECLRTSESTRDIPVLAISANAMPEDLARGKAAGFVDYITKPLEVGRMLEVINNILKDIPAGK